METKIIEPISPEIGEELEYFIMFLDYITKELHNVSILPEEFFK